MSGAPHIRRLDETTANQIAAGEVIERPAAVIKELVENAIDAGASAIDIRYKDGGKTLIQVRDNGIGIAEDELPLSIERHATSKLNENNLFAISSFGFRGEALPSIGAVARLSIASKRHGGQAAQIDVDGGRVSPVAPVALAGGTRVEVRDLFFATPARLKFLSSDRAETMAINDAIKRIAMANPDIHFTLTELREDTQRVVFDLPASDQGARLKAVLGKTALDDCLALDAERDGVRLSGYIGLPSAAKGSASAQYVFVNGRPVRDKLFFGAIKGAYSDLLPSGKFPFVVLFMEIAPDAIDVNVHPAKSEIRFRQAADIRSFVLNAIRHRLAERGMRADQSLSRAFGHGMSAPERQTSYQASYAPAQRFGAHRQEADQNTAMLAGFGEAPQAFAPQALSEAEDSGQLQALPLGLARAQYHQNYIIAETEDGLVIIDQHAAHERLVYERLKQDYREKRLEAQRLLVPEIISLGAAEREALLSQREWLAEIGIEIEAFGIDAIAVHSVPALLNKAAPKAIIDTIRDALDDDPRAAIEKRIDDVLSSIACHGSVRSGRALRPEEMNALLREMEATPNSESCNHGRPTFIKLDLKFLEARFGR